MVSSVQTDDSIAVELGSSSDRGAWMSLSEDGKQNDSPGEASPPQEMAADHEPFVSPGEDGVLEKGTTFHARFTEHCDEWRMVQLNYTDAEAAPCAEADAEAAPCSEWETVLPWIPSAPVSFETTRNAEEEAFPWLNPKGTCGWKAPRPSPIHPSLGEYFRSRLRLRDGRFRHDPAWLLMTEGVMRHIVLAYV